MMMMMETSLSSSSSSARFRRVQQLAVPWASIVFSALVYAAVLLASSDDDDESSNSNTLNYYYYYEDHQQRALWEQDSNSIQPHHHAPVVNEFHKPLFPLDSSDIYGFVACTLGLMIAAGGGVGGGGILVPIYILIFGFSPKHAIPLSNVTVFGGAIANVLLNTQKRHPLADRPLVDWDLILVMEPLTIAGALIGAFLNKVLPETLLTFLLVALLTFTAHNTLTKATKMYKKETAQIKADKESELAKLAAKELDEDEEAEASLLKHAQERPVNDDYDDNEQQDVDGMQEALLEEDLKKELQAIIDQEREAPLINIKILVALFVVVLAVNLLKGGGAFPSPLGIKCGSTSFWMANIFMLAWILVISFFVRAYLVKKHHRKLTVGFEFLEGDMKWDARATLVYPIVCMAAGFCAGMFGIGGGIGTYNKHVVRWVECVCTIR
jgi:uncharacterized membrane protein YfcA